MTTESLLSRRSFITKVASFMGVGLVSMCPLVLAKSSNESNESNKSEENKIEVLPNEDLMREHGALRRILLIYREVIRRLSINQEMNPDVLTRSAQIIKNFIEDYHEKLEEDYLFPRFEKHHQLTDLVETLKSQHQAGRKITTFVLQNKMTTQSKTGKNKEISHALQNFIRMYEPHAAREDTVLFPALREIISKNEYSELGEKFEDMEHDRFGKNGFENIIKEISDIEKELNIYDLAQFTPT